MVMGDADSAPETVSVVRRLSSVICYRRTLVFLILPKIGGAVLCDEGLSLLGKGIVSRCQVADAERFLATGHGSPATDD